MHLFLAKKLTQLLKGDIPRLNAQEPTQIYGHLPQGKALTYFKIGVISVSIVSMDEVEVFGPSRMRPFASYSISTMDVFFSNLP
jgi:hypothetical protein